jgi:hypothetical protein
VSSEIRKLSDGEVELVDSNVFDKLMLLSKSKHAADETCMWTEYCSACHRPSSEKAWSSDTGQSDSYDVEVTPMCMVMMSRNTNQNQPPQKLSAAGRKPKLKLRV